MGDMDEVDNVKQGRGESKEVVAPDSSKQEEESITVDQSSVAQTEGRRSPLGGNEVKENSSDATALNLVNGETDTDLRRGSTHSHRSRHGSGSSSSSRKSRSRHKSKHQDKDASKERSNSWTWSGSAGKHRKKHSNLAKKNSVDTAMTADPENQSEDDAEISVVHVDSFTVSSDKDRLHKEEKKIKKKLLNEKEKYAAEKQQLRAKMEKARRNVKEEIAQYETELNDKRQDYLSKMTNLQLDEQHEALSQRMEELTDIRQELDSRFQQCMEYEAEIEEIERYLDRRQQLCNSKEEDLRRLDDQLDTLQQELELDKERLERAGFDVKSVGSRKRASSFKSSTENENDDYILKTNLRKCQVDLKKAEQMLFEKDMDATDAKEEISSLEAQKKKHKEKIKQLETQLSVALSQLKNQTNSAHSPNATLNRQASMRSHVSLDRFKSPGDLSINQQAQLNRSLSGKDKGRTSPAAKKYLSFSSSTVNSSPKSESDHSRGSSEGAQLNTNTHGNDASWQDSAAQTRTVSSTCSVM
ncbi:golgin-84-like [Asterias rubens]|uniref:golgin-84-like n=1 Tax=Asterias rubens TaxID=7604 RepID=UPI001455377B|nr:golgin-84-like [Asterias rubens]XP_033634796.1 golgin-84-like [Asterias rubens]